MLKLCYEVRGFELVSCKKVLAHAVGKTVVVVDLKIARDCHECDDREDAAVFTVPALLRHVTPRDYQSRPPSTHHLVYCRTYDV